MTFLGRAVQSCIVGSRVHDAGGTRSLRPAQAQDLSGKPIRLIVGLSAGGATDVMARLVAQKMSESLRTTVIVENKVGGNFIPALRELTGAAARRPHAVLHLHQRADHAAAASGLSVRSHQAHSGHAGRDRAADPGGAQRHRDQERARADRPRQQEPGQAARSASAAGPEARSISRPSCSRPGPASR